MMQENISLAEHSNYKIGGPARYFCEATSIDEIHSVLKKWTGPLLVIGGGTNILFPDEGFNGLVLKPSIQKLEVNGSLVSVGAGVLIHDLLEFTVNHGLSGLEWAGGLPGFVGGAIRGNAGAFGGEIKDSITSVTSLDISGSEPIIRKRTNSECEFGYRNSIFKKRDKDGRGRQEIVLECELDLAEGNPEAIKKAIEEKVQYRKERQPLEYPNVGSIFKNVDAETVSEELRERAKDVIKTDPFPVIPTAYLLSEAGLKGAKHGGAEISQKHPNFIINTGTATAADVKALIALAKEKVKNQLGVELEEEVIIL